MEMWEASHNSGLFCCPASSSGKPTFTTMHWGCCSGVLGSVTNSWKKGGIWSPRAAEGVLNTRICRLCERDGVPLLHPDKRVEIAKGNEWEAGVVIPQSQGKRKAVHITPESERRVKNFADRAQASSKVPSTLAAYSAAERVWVEMRTIKGWSVFLETPPLGYAEANHQAIYWASHLATEHGNSPNTIVCKQSAITWFHIRHSKPSPFQKLETYKKWLADLKKNSNPPDPKVPVPPQMVQLIVLCCNNTLNGEVIRCAISTQLWYLLRVVEVLGTDSGRSLTWGDVFPRNKEGEYLELHDMTESNTYSLTLRLYCKKGRKHTCTRTLKRRPGLSTCPVTRFIALYTAYIMFFEKSPPKHQSPFLLQDGTVFTRDKEADILKAAASTCGIPSDRVSTHSLRRGGCSAYSSAGVSDQELMRFGRWSSSTSFERYVTAHEDMFDLALKDVGHMVPIFDLH